MASEQLSLKENSKIFDRDSIPTSALPANSTLIVGIGGHQAPPNSRLFSYVLPAVQLASSHGVQKIELLLSTSLLEKRRQMPEEQHKIDVHTLSKLLLLRKFIREFFTKTFQCVDAYFGEKFPQISAQTWEKVWETLLSDNPELELEVKERQNVWRIEKSNLIRYALQHAIWFRDICNTKDHEIPYKQNSVHVSIGGHQEEFFNRIRVAVSQLSAEELNKIAPDTFIHPQSRQFIVSSSNPVPYGQATHGKGDKRFSAEAEIDKPCSPFPKGERLKTDIDYTVRALASAGASESDFLRFWQTIQNDYQRLAAKISDKLQKGNEGFHPIFSDLSSQ